MKIFLRSFLLALAFFIVIFAACQGRGEAQPSHQPSGRYRTSDRPKHIEPGDLCFDSFVSGYQTCLKHDEEWAAGSSEKMKWIKEASPIACKTAGVIWYDHCRWATAEPGVYDCHHGHED